MGFTVFGYLSPLVLCLFFFDGHRIHVVGSDKQGLVSEFCADLCQEFLRMGNLLEKGKSEGLSLGVPTWESWVWRLPGWGLWV